MAQELIKIETRVGRDLTATPVVVYSPAAGEKVSLLFVLIHAMEDIANNGLSILAGSNILINVKNDSTNPGIPDQVTSAASGTFVLSHDKVDQIKLAQIKIPTIDDITNVNTLQFKRVSSVNTNITTSVWAVREL